MHRGISEPTTREITSEEKIILSLALYSEKAPAAPLDELVQ